MNIFPVTEQTFPQAVNLLRENNLPTEDISANTRLFTLYHENELVGTVGLELADDAALLRSLCIAANQRTHGSGSRLVQFAEEAARKEGIAAMYLLTTTAAAFFSNRAYKTISREEVPHSIRQTTEFASVCPSSATVMKKNLL